MENKFAWKTKTRIFPEAGRLTLITHEADGSDTKDPSKIYTSGTSIVDSITTKYSTTSEEMNDGNGFDAAATHITGRNVEVAVVMNTHDPELFKFASSADVDTKEGGYIFIQDDEYTIGTDGKVLLNTNSINPNGVLLVRREDNSDYEIIKDGAPKEGECKADYNTATLTFNDADKGKTILVSAEYECEISTTMGVPAKPKENTYTLIATGKNCDKGNYDELADNFIIDSCKIKGDIQPPARQKTYTSCTYTFGVVRPRPGKKSFDMQTAKVKERATTSGAAPANPAPAPAPDCTLASLSVGSLTLDPAFSADVTAYTAATTNATNTVTAAATDSGATVSIKNNSADVTNGSSVTWDEGENVLEITVTNGTANKVYTVTVTKS